MSTYTSLTDDDLRVMLAAIGAGRSRSCSPG